MPTALWHFHTRIQPSANVECPTAITACISYLSLGAFVLLLKRHDARVARALDLWRDKRIPLHNSTVDVRDVRTNERNAHAHMHGVCVFTLHRYRAHGTRER